MRSSNKAIIHKYNFCLYNNKTNNLIKAKLINLFHPDDIFQESSKCFTKFLKTQLKIWLFVLNFWVYCVSTVAEHLTAQHSAIKMLHSRVKLVLEYVRAVQAGKLPINHEVLREAHSLSHRLPVLQTDRFTTDFYNVSLPLF